MCVYTGTCTMFELQLFNSLLALPTSLPKIPYSSPHNSLLISSPLPFSLSSLFLSPPSSSLLPLPLSSLFFSPPSSSLLPLPLSFLFLPPLPPFFVPLFLSSPLSPSSSLPPPLSPLPPSPLSPSGYTRHL